MMCYYSLLCRVPFAASCQSATCCRRCLWLISFRLFIILNIFVVQRILSVYVLITAGFAIADVIISTAIILSLILSFYDRDVAYHQELFLLGSSRRTFVPKSVGFSFCLVCNILCSAVTKPCNFVLISTEMSWFIGLAWLLGQCLLNGSVHVY